MTLSLGSVCLSIETEKPYVEEDRVSTNTARMSEITWTSVFAWIRFKMGKTALPSVELGATVRRNIIGFRTLLRRRLQSLNFHL